MSSTNPPNPDAPSPTAAAAATPIDPQRALALQQALLKGLGVPDLKLPEGLNAQLMEELGRMLREMTEGTVDMLRLRSQAKSSIHAEMTIIGPRAVNPLKARG